MYPFTVLALGLALLVGDGAAAGFSIALGKGDKKQANKNGSTLKKNSNINFSTKKVGGKKKNWQSNKLQISRKMQNIGLPALR